MRNLLAANWFRLRKSLLFWTVLLLMALFGAWMPFQTFMEYGREVPLDQVFFVYTMVLGLLLPVFFPLFFGAEYSDGAIRSKLAVGHTRLSVYLSNFVSEVWVALLFSAVYLLFTLAVGVPLLGGPKTPVKLLLTILLLSLLMAAVWCGIFNCVILNLSRKAGAAVSCILIFIALFMLATWVYSRLDAPEFIPAYELLPSGEMISKTLRNDAFLQPKTRVIFEFLLDLNPVGQAIQYVDLNIARPVQLALSSLGTVVVTSAIGAGLFQRKDLK